MSTHPFHSSLPESGVAAVPSGDPASLESAAAQIARRLDTSLLTAGRVVVIGLGGIGLPLARSVATFLGGICYAVESLEMRLVLQDGDSFQDENTYRMDIPSLGNKAEVLGHELLQRISCPNLLVRWVTEYVTPDNVTQAVRDRDCVFLACDNHATRNVVGRTVRPSTTSPLFPVAMTEWRKGCGAPMATCRSTCGATAEIGPPHSIDFIPRSRRPRTGSRMRSAAWN